MTKEIEKILNDVLEREGWPVYTNHSMDKGGPTKGGITIRTLESWRHKRCTRAELQKLTKEEALKILNRRYAESNGIQLLPQSQARLKTQLIDDAVLSGPQLAVKDLQRTLVVSADGIIGPKTLAAIGNVNLDHLCNRLAVTRSLRLARHVKQNPDQIVFLVGWMSRCLSFVS